MAAWVRPCRVSPVRERTGARSGVVPMTRPDVERLPVEEALPALSAALAEGRNAVLVAPPGAGKTTTVPLRLLDAPWRGDGRIILLEPRRLAARAAGGPDGVPDWGAGGPDGRAARPHGHQGRAGDPDRGRDRGRVHPPDPRRPDAGRDRRGDLRRVPRAIARCRSRSRLGDRRAERIARRPASTRDVRDARRRTRGAAPRRGPGDPLGGARLPGRDALPGAGHDPADRGRGHGRGAARPPGRHGIRPGVPAGRRRDPARRARFGRAPARPRGRRGAALSARWSGASRTRRSGRHRRAVARWCSRPPSPRPRSRSRAYAWWWIAGSPGCRATSPDRA